MRTGERLKAPWQKRMYATDKVLGVLRGEQKLFKIMHKIKLHLCVVFVK